MCCRSCATSLNARSIMFVACHTTKPAWHTVFPVANITLETILSDRRRRMAVEQETKAASQMGTFYRRDSYSISLMSACSYFR